MEIKKKILVQVDDIVINKVIFLYYHKSILLMYNGYTIL